MDTNKINDLAKILRQNQLTKLDLTEGDTRIVLEAGGRQASSVPIKLAKVACLGRGAGDAKLWSSASCTVMGLPQSAMMDEGLSGSLAVA